MARFILALFVSASLFMSALPTTLAHAASEEVIKKQLDETGMRLVKYAAGSVQPPKSKKSVTKEGSEYVARYVEIDPASMRTELRPAAAPNTPRVGLVRYQEVHYECRGATKSAALKAECLPTRTRRLTEMISYDGKWSY